MTVLSVPAPPFRSENPETMAGKRLKVKSETKQTFQSKPFP